MLTYSLSFFFYFNLETEITKEALKDVDKALENAFEISKRYETRIQELESECHALQNSKDILSKEKEHISVKLLSSIGMIICLNFYIEIICEYMY